MPLFKDAHEDVRLEQWAPGASIELEPDGGLEVLVLEGGFRDGGETYGPQSWLRLPPDFFTEDTPTAVLVRQVLGAISQFEKATLVAKMKAARDRKAALTGKRCGGPASHSERRPEVVALAKRLRRQRLKGGPRSLRAISAELAKRGHFNDAGRPFAAVSIA